VNFVMYARALPIDLPEAETYYPLKFAIARRYLDHDGSLMTEPFKFEGDRLKNLVNWLEGVRDAGGKDTEIGLEAANMIAMIKENPQGIEVWIGE
jgi:hypothetical protein